MDGVMDLFDRFAWPRLMLARGRDLEEFRRNAASHQWKVVLFTDLTGMVLDHRLPTPTCVPTSPKLTPKERLRAAMEEASSSHALPLVE